MTTTSNAPKISATTVIANDPKLLAAYLQDHRNQVTDIGRFGIFKAVGLSADQIRAMKDLMVEREQQRIDLLAAVETKGLDRQSDTYKTLNAQNEQSYLKKQAEILGDLEPAYREFERTEEVRWRATGFAQAGLWTGEPITASQLNQVTQILAANTERIQSGPKTGYVNADTVNWNVARSQLKSVLTPPQIEMLQTCYEAHANVIRLENEIGQRQALLTAQFKKS